MRFWRTLILLIGTAILALGLHVCSSDRDLEVSLKVDSLPKTIRNKQVQMNAWTDYSVRAYFEIAPADFEFLLTRRPYEKLVIPEVLNMKVSEFRPCPLNRIFPEIEEFEVSDVYSWQKTETMTSITIWTNKNRDRVFLLYGTD